MKYFRERHNLRTDYSGYQAISDSLSKRLNAVCKKYIAHHGIGAGQGGYWIPNNALGHELFQYLENDDIEQIIHCGTPYDCVFEGVEIFLSVARECASRIYYEKILPDVQRAFELSGSVYYVDRDGLITLRMDEKLAKDLKETQEVLSVYEIAHKTLFDAVGNLMGRKDKAKNIVKDIFVALESYLKEVAKVRDFGKAINYLQREEIITVTQKSLLEKIYAYRSDAFAVGHAGGTKEPDEIDALWFLDVVLAQLKLIDRRLKEKSIT